MYVIKVAQIVCSDVNRDLVKKNIIKSPKHRDTTTAEFAELRRDSLRNILQTSPISLLIIRVYILWRIDFSLSLRPQRTPRCLNKLGITNCSLLKKFIIQP